MLFGARGADLADSEATGTILNTEIPTGSFENVPAEHDGSTAFSFDAFFNSEIGISYATLRDDSFTVTEGDVTAAKRVDGWNDRWNITVTPSGNEAVTITLPGNRDFATPGAICSKEENPVQLSNSPSATVAGPAAVSSVPVTASFGNMPAEHDGSEFTLDLSFSENVEAGNARIRDDAFTISGGNIIEARRKTQGSNQNWTVKVEPDGSGAISITLPETTNCDDAGAICTDDGLTPALGSDRTRTGSRQAERLNHGPVKRPEQRVEKNRRPSAMTESRPTSRLGSLDHKRDAGPCRAIRAAPHHDQATRKGLYRRIVVTGHPPQQR